MATVRNSVESARGCGYRKSGGIYLVSGGVMAACGRMPIRLDVCPTCHHGIHPARGWTWIDLQALTGLTERTLCSSTYEQTLICRQCPTNGSVKMVGLLWVGEKFYPTPDDFLREANAMGVSRRISQVPKDFVVGETWVFFAHRKTFSEPCDASPDNMHTIDCECEGTGKVWSSGMFHAFKPTAIEYVVKGDETEEELDKLEKRGFSLVNVIKSGGPLLEAVEEDDDVSE